MTDAGATNAPRAPRSRMAAPSAIGRVHMQPAFVLHIRPYRETSLLVNFLSPDFGMLSAVARGARRRSRAGANVGALLRPFVPLRVSWRGRRELKTLEAAESAGGALLINGSALYAAMYLNELLLRALSPHDPDTALFAAYHHAITGLGGSAALESVLRRFEFTLLERLGYGLDWHRVSEGHGRYVEDIGLQPCAREDPGSMPAEHLLAIARGDYASSAIRRAAKRLARAALRPLLGAAPLRSRELFRP